MADASTAKDSKPEFDPLVDKAPARYVVGIDLGTTNSAVMYVDTQKSPWQIQMLSLPQLVAADQVESLDTLPSFHYQIPAQDRIPNVFPKAFGSNESSAGASDSQGGATDRDRSWCVGTMARDEGGKSPGRLIASAKSWLCHTGVDRTAKLLPWHPADDVDRLSPVEVTSRYLAHIRDAWNQQFPGHSMAAQDLVITLPASFDEVARELTVQAAAMAELPNVVLIEEPQAAFYAWVYKHDDNWADLVTAGHTILVCDIGGGTSDFTLIKVRQTEEEARVQFHRVAVGEHLILGGDNLDMALAHSIEAKLAAGGKLSPNQWDVLVRSCRRVKETLLGEGAPERATVRLPGSGSKLIGGGLQAEVTRQEVERLLVDGFLPQCQLADRPSTGQSGFREFGLPFAADPAITRHLATFLLAHPPSTPPSTTTSPAPTTLPIAVTRPDAILFNGGFFASPILRASLLQALNHWYAPAGDPSWQPIVLDNDRLDLAVARGAAYYGMVRRGQGVRIAANLARSYYVEVATASDQPQAVCLVPGHAEPGQDIHLQQPKLALQISQPVEFSLLVSSTRLTDQPGDMVAINLDQMKPLPPIRTVLRTDRKNQSGTIPVTLHAHLSEVGTIDLWCQAEESDFRWRLQFDVRSATQTDRRAHESQAEAEGVVDEATWTGVEKVIDTVFGKEGKEKPSQLVNQLSETLALNRFEWPTSLLRRIWERLMTMQEGRRRSSAHEARWLNLLGFALRPGYGLAVDDWRVAETWRHVRGKLVHAGASQVESLILWRRIAGGLSAGQQNALAELIISSLRAAHASATTGQKSRGIPTFTMHESSEAWRLLGSLELLSVPVKTQIGGITIELIEKRQYAKVRSPMLWALGRMGQRQPLYGPINTVVPAEEAGKWCHAIMRSKRDDSAHLAMMQLARLTGDRYRDIDDALRDEIAQWLTETAAPRHLIDLVTQGGTLAEEEQNQLFGEALPKGLRVM